MASLPSKFVKYQFDSRNPPDYNKDREDINDLIRGPREYAVQLNEIADRTRKVFELNLDDVCRQTSEEFVSKFETNFLRYVNMLAEVIDEALPDTTEDESKWDRIDVLMKTRERIQEQREEEDSTTTGKLPKDLTRRYEISVTPRAALPSYAVRDVGAEHIGRLVTVTGLVTRVSSVKPLVFVAAYVCDACGYESYQSVRSTQFMPLLECSAPACRAATKQARMHLQTRTSRFLKHQELTLQESPDQVPVGAIPRSMRVLVRGESVRQCHAGEKISVTGVKIPLQKSGFRAMKAGLTTDTTFDAILIRKSKPGYADEVDEEEEYEEAIQEMSESRDSYERLAESIAPEIYGLKDLKKALLLLMVGGVTKRMSDGLTIRGDINVILMGDPGVAKSQLLKHICTIAPRGIYTTGKGSSGAGLTAAVVRDPITDEMVLEGGALVLADMGIAAIDEFDKMEESDRTAIHEVMEQQTISISKAGICTTLNARASILAAANPVFGRYDKRKTPEENIELPAALMSRFDLMFIMVDKPSRSDDEELARHICHVHQHLRPVQHELHLQSPAFLRAYIKKARTFEPSVPRELTQHVVGTYLQARAEGRQAGARRLMPTPRTLLSVLRLSQALARLRFADVVSEADIEEATRLWQESRASMLDDDDEEMVQRRQDIVSQIYSAVKNYMNKLGKQVIKLRDVMNHLHGKGYLEKDIEEAFVKYEALDVMFRNDKRTTLTLVESR